MGSVLYPVGDESHSSLVGPFPQGSSQSVGKFSGGPISGEVQWFVDPFSGGLPIWAGRYVPMGGPRRKRNWKRGVDAGGARLRSLYAAGSSRWLRCERKAQGFSEFSYQSGRWQTDMRRTRAEERKYQYLATFPGSCVTANDSSVVSQLRECSVD